MELIEIGPNQRNVSCEISVKFVATRYELDARIV